MVNTPKIINFIRSLYGDETYLPLHAPIFIGNEKKYLTECIDSTYVSTIGPYVNELESSISEYTNSKRAIACVNGTSALHLALELINLNEGHEVITQPLSFVATVNSILYTGASPVFVDISKDTLGMCPYSLKAFIDENCLMTKKGLINKNTQKIIKAVVPMHTFGFPCEVDAIQGICKEFGLHLIEDAAEGLGSFYNDMHVGTFGSIGVISFNGNKIATAGGGGILLFNDDKLADMAKHLSNQAKLPSDFEFNHDQVGYNYRMPNVNAAIALAQLEKIENFVSFKRELSEKYSDFFSNMGVCFFNEPSNCRSNYWLNTLIMENETERNDLLKESNQAGILCRPAWKLLSDLIYCKDYSKFDLTVANNFAKRIVNLPSGVFQKNT